MKLFCLSLTYKFKCELCLLINAFGFTLPSSYFALLGVPLPTYSDPLPQSIRLHPGDLPLRLKPYLALSLLVLLFSLLKQDTQPEVT